MKTHFQLLPNFWWRPARARNMSAFSISSHPLLEKQNKKKEKGCDYYTRRKCKLQLSEQVCHCNFYFVVLLIFLVKQFSFRFQFSKSNIQGTCPIGFAAARYQSISLEKSCIHPDQSNKLTIFRSQLKITLKPIAEMFNAVLNMLLPVIFIITPDRYSFIKYFSKLISTNEGKICLLIS